MGFVLGSNALLALLAAGFWGVGDFSGGMGAKTAGGTTAAALRMVLLSHITSFTVLLGVLWLRGDPFPHGAPLAWGIGAGVAGGLSLTAFYIALARGAMGVSAAISGLLAAAVPAIVSIAMDGLPGLHRGLGFLVAGVAIWLIAAGPSAAHEDASTMWLSLGAGVGFGVYFVALKYAGAAGPIWPMAIARMGSITLCSCILLAMRDGGGVYKITHRTIVWVLFTALFDTSGNLLFVAATRAGRLDVAAVLASLYPASTILLAAWMLREKPTRRQGIGMAIAACAVALITL